MIRVLMVDRDPDFLGVSKVFLEENNNILVDTLPSATKALDQIQSTIYDAVIFDTDLPEMDGIAFLREVRGRDPSIPCVLFAGNDDKDLIIDVLNNGASYFLRKSDDPLLQFPELMDAIEGVMAERKEYLAVYESEKRFRDITENLPQPIFQINAAGDIEYANSIALEMFGYSAEDLDGGLHILQMVVPEDRSRAKESIWWTLREISLGDNEYNGLKKNGTVFPIVVFSKPIIRDGFATGLRGIVLDITNRRNTERAHRESEERLNLAIESANLYVFDWYLDSGEVVHTMRRSTPSGGLSSELEGEVGTWEQFVHPEDLPRMMKGAQDHFEGKKPYFEVELRLKRSDNKWRWVEMRGKVMGRDEEGSPVKMTGIYQDITEKVKKEQILKGREAQFRTLFNRMNCGGCIFKAFEGGKDFIATDINYSGEVIEEKKKSVIVGKSLQEIYPPRASKQLFEAMSVVWKTGKPQSVPPFLFEGQKKPQWREYYIYSLPSEEIIAIYNDISERIHAQKQILNSLKVKETLIKEIHHRVKNNLQVIASILKLQSLRTTDEEALDVLRDCRNRVFSIAMIHEELYRSDDLAHIQIANYIKKLGEHLIYEFLSVSPEISLAVDCDDNLTLDIDTGIPCGLIIDELVTNSLKYAFKDGERGTIRIAFSELGEEWYRLIVSDDGVGFPESIDFKATESLGMQLVVNLVEQLGGTIELGQDKGTEFIIQFPASAS